MRGTKKDKKSTLKLKKSEKWILVGEGFITAGIILLLYYSAYQIFQILVNAFPNFFSEFWILGDLIIQMKDQSLLEVNPFVYIFLFLLAILAIIWRLVRRYRSFEMKHVISELNYIAAGNFEHRIPSSTDADLQEFINSIHVLVDSTVAAMEEERRIEQTKDELITNVSHDIRTPLTSIIGYLELVTEKRYQSFEEVESYVETAYQKAQQMRFLVDDLFEYTSVHQSDAPLNITRFDMIQLLEQLAIDFLIEAENKGMEIRIIRTENKLMMHGDSEKLVRVFSNLISNALKYGQGGKNIIIKIIQKSSDKVTIIIKNDGKKIPEEALGQIFERFYRAESSRTQELASTGLGLAIVKSIVELHSGEISVETTKDWTLFTLELPRDLKKALELEKINNEE
ncbi:MAG: HAMP domain-containing histidine kinase [Atopostipes suicloacalis]|nr:HAMP domain-containing histidine kinase [Atopostipes suicloacalis]